MPVSHTTCLYPLRYHSTVILKMNNICNLVEDMLFLKSLSCCQVKAHEGLPWLERKTSFFAFESLTEASSYCIMMVLFTLSRKSVHKRFVAMFQKFFNFLIWFTLMGRKENNVFSKMTVSHRRKQSTKSSSTNL